LRGWRVFLREKRAGFVSAKAENQKRKVAVKSKKGETTHAKGT